MIIKAYTSVLFSAWYTGANWSSGDRVLSHVIPKYTYTGFFCIEFEIER